MFRYSAVPKKQGMVKDDTKLTFLGFGTMNGKRRGNRSRQREGGVMRLENLIRDINEEMYKKSWTTAASKKKMQERLQKL